ncbi:DUF4422 domain-containing protein [Mitsuokella sp.]
MGIYIVGSQKVSFDRPKGYEMILVGKKNKNARDPSCFYDDVNDSIAEKNPYYCELTALYWIWKNTSDKFIGLNHYRRFFWLNHPNDSYIIKSINDEKEIANMITFSTPESILQGADIILPAPLFMGESLEKQYERGNRKIDFDITRKVVYERYPKYASAFEQVAKGHIFYPCNMFFTYRKYFDQYAEWLFSILFEVEKRTNIPYDDPYQRRIFGFLSERLLEVFVLHHNLKIKEIPMLFFDPQGKVQSKKRGYSYKIYRLSPSLYFILKRIKYAIS